MYGYMRTVYGIPDIVLYLGASYAQLAAGTTKLEWIPVTWGDAPIDQFNIKRGIDYYYEIHSAYEKGGDCE